MVDERLERSSRVGGLLAGDAVREVLCCGCCDGVGGGWLRVVGRELVRGLYGDCRCRYGVRGACGGVGEAAGIGAVLR